jgi:hypothetical protein
MEGRTALQQFTSKLSDLTMQAIAFDCQSLKHPPSEEAMAAHIRFKNNFVHLVSLMHGVALMTMRDDLDMENTMVCLSASCSLLCASCSQASGNAGSAPRKRRWQPTPVLGTVLRTSPTSCMA